MELSISSLFERARRDNAGEQIIELPEDPSRDYFDLADLLEPEITPASAEWCATIYFNPEIFPTPSALDRVERHYAVAFPNREFRYVELRVEHLVHGPGMLRPNAEKVFRQRGFVSDIEFYGFSNGNAPVTAHHANCEAAAHFQLALIASYLSRRGEHELSDWNRNQLKALWGTDNVTPVPLVLRDGLFLPCAKFWNAEKIHFAHSSALDGALVSGRADKLHLCNALPEEIAAQIAIERRSSRQMFNGASSVALYLWQAQALAVLRRALWKSDFLASAFLAKQEEEAASRRNSDLNAIASRRLRPDDYFKKYPRNESAYLERLYGHTKALKKEKEKFISAMTQRTWVQGKDIYGDYFNDENFSDEIEFKHHLSDIEILIAALHGSTYLHRFDHDDEYDREHPLQWLHGVALWIGELKRKRHRTLNERMAHCLLAIDGAKLNGSEDVFLAQGAALLVDRLGAEGWDALVTASNRLLGGDINETVHVVYEWALNPEMPRWAAQRDDATVICGPLLDFPTYAAAEWNRKAQIVLEERGLILRHKRDDNGRIVERKR